MVVLDPLTFQMDHLYHGPPNSVDLNLGGPLKNIYRPQKQTLKGYLRYITSQYDLHGPFERP